MKRATVILIALLLSLPVEQLWAQEYDNFCPRTRLMMDLLWELQHGNSCPLTMNVPDLDKFTRSLMRMWSPHYDDFCPRIPLMIELLLVLRRYDSSCLWSYESNLSRSRFERDTAWMIEFHSVIRRALLHCYTVSDFFDEWISLSMQDQQSRAIRAISWPSSQIPYNTPDPLASHSLRDAPRRAWATFEGDTARYLEFNYTIRGAQYIGWTLREFLEELELPVIGIAPRSVISLGTRPTPPHLIPLMGGLLSMVIRHAGDTFNELRDYYIEVRLENMPTSEELREIPRSENSVRIWGFEPEVLDFLKDLRLSGIWANPQLLQLQPRDSELMERQRQRREERDWRWQDQAIREYRDKQGQESDYLRQRHEHERENLVRQQVQDVEYFLQQQELERKNLVMSQQQERLNMVIQQRQAKEYFLQQRWQEREQNPIERQQQEQETK